MQGNGAEIENLTIANTSGPVGQAVALHVEGDRFVMKIASYTDFRIHFMRQQHKVDSFIRIAILREPQILGAADNWNPDLSFNPAH